MWGSAGRRVWVQERVREGRALLGRRRRHVGGTVDNLILKLFVWQYSLQL